MYQRNKTRATKTVPTQNKSNRKDQEGASQSPGNVWNDSLLQTPTRRAAATGRITWMGTSAELLTI